MEQGMYLQVRDYGIGSRLQDFQRQNIFCDLTLRGKDGVDIPVHKCVMCSMFTAIHTAVNSVEDNDKCCVILSLGFNYDTLQTLVDISYNGRAYVQDDHQVKAMFEAAHELGMTAVVEVQQQPKDTSFTTHCSTDKQSLTNLQAKTDSPINSQAHSHNGVTSVPTFTSSDIVKSQPIPPENDDPFVVVVEQSDNWHLNGTQSLKETAPSFSSEDSQQFTESLTASSANVSKSEPLVRKRKFDPKVLEFLRRKKSKTVEKNRTTVVGDQLALENTDEDSLLSQLEKEESGREMNESEVDTSTLDNAEDSSIGPVVRMDDPDTTTLTGQRSSDPSASGSPMVFECSTCSKAFRTRSAYKDHQATHHNCKPFKCDQCGAAYASKYNLRDHMDVHLYGERRYKCDQCHRSFGDVCRLKRHVVLHDPHRQRMHQCPECSKSFFQPSNLINHIKNVHQKQTVACEVCGKEIDQFRLKRHMNLHTGEEQFECDICHIVYRQKPSLDHHKKYTHGVGVDSAMTYYCEICQKDFLNKVTLEKHMIRHTGEKSFQCSLCPAKFYTRGEVDKHELHHLDLDKRPFVCGVCNKSFIREYDLKTHTRTHGDNKPFVCEICNKGFRWKNKLKEHTRLHTGERPFKCRYCDERFIDCAFRRHHEKKVHTFESHRGSLGSQQSSKRASRISYTVSNAGTELAPLIGEPVFNEHSATALLSASTTLLTPSDTEPQYDPNTQYILAQDELGNLQYVIQTKEKNQEDLNQQLGALLAGHYQQ